MLKILQARLQQCDLRTSRYTNWVLKRQRNQRSNCQHSLDHGESKEITEKNIYFCFIDYTKTLTAWITTNWEILKEMGIPDHLTCLLRNLYVGQDATVRTRHEMTDWFKIGKRVWQGCIWSPCLFKLYPEYIIWNAGLDESQAGMKIPGRNVNNLRYPDDTTLIAESDEELKSLLMRVNENSEKAC